MGDDYHRPTYTTSNVHGAYNATQVRLYGIPGLTGNHEDGKFFSGKTKEYGLAAIGIKYTGDRIEPAKLDEIRVKLGLDSLPSSAVFINTKIQNYMIMLAAISLNSDPVEKLSSGVIFGYAYEGHCYDLPKPKIMLIPATDEEIPCDDCGYELKKGSNYRVWIVDKLQECIELDMNQGFIEQLVLEANLPGRRSPTMYAGKMMTAHRSGRLTE